MKKVLITIVGLMFCVGLMTSNAAGKKQLTPEQQKVKKELMEKYDANKDGQLDKQERDKMTDADKAKMNELRGTPAKKKEKAK